MKSKTSASFRQLFHLLALSPYTVGSTQCIPLPWGTNYLSQLNTFIQAVAAHIGTDSSLDHVVVTGINSTTQENMQPHCSPASTASPYICGIDGVHSDIDNWVSIIQPGHPSCTATSCAVYNELLLGGPGIPNAYATIVGYWGSAFPSSVKLASMFVNSGNNSFPFNTTTDLGLGLLNDVVSYNSSRSIVMNNAASLMSPVGTLSPSPDLANPILCYKGSETPGFTCQTPAPQPTSFIAFQELDSLIHARFTCSDLTTFLGAASTDGSAFMETYPLDINTCF